METKEFSQEEFELILQKAQSLIQRNYFSGINFLQSEAPLPKERIIVHFLHNSREHIEGIITTASIFGQIVPRYSLYRTRLEYFQDGGIEDKYREAIFFDKKGKTLTRTEALIQEEVYTLNPELDLLIPFYEAEGLEEVVARIKKADSESAEAWYDPVIIIRSAVPLTLPDFGEKISVSLSKEHEEFYTILPSEEKKRKLTRYLKKLCKNRNLGTLQYKDIVFSPSQINGEFFQYLGLMDSRWR